MPSAPPIANAADDWVGLGEGMCLQGCPPVNILIWSSEESRLSDFILWQLAHARLQSIDVLWSAFSFWDLLKALVKWQMAHPELKKMARCAEQQR